MGNRQQAISNWQLGLSRNKVAVSEGWMPGVYEVMKDVVSGDKLLGAAREYYISEDFRMGQPAVLPIYFCSAATTGMARIF
ncbi:MAG: hypothetical protein M3040_16000 [Bacteroidota bacterium]|nr:hypothetical protein [Bacteroidota bacterium]